jgi:hypothetical protein
MLLSAAATFRVKRLWLVRGLLFGLFALIAQPYWGQAGEWGELQVLRTAGKISWLRRGGASRKLVGS